MNPISVSSLNFYVKSLLEENEPLQNITVVGEISNFKNHYSSSHLYFSLKDKKSIIRCVMFAGFVKGLNFMPSDGMSVVASGRVSLYEQTGAYQFYVSSMCPDGVGDLSVAFELLKEKLKNEGLFDEAIKKQIPKFPKKIAVVTSKTGSVLHDILNVLNRRYPVGEILFYPVAVQGKNAAYEIANTVTEIDQQKEADVLIIARGGGSLEELWAFNEEILARAVFSLKIPVVSAIGHETDFTICDFVSDLRAPTPSAAAELISTDLKEVTLKIKMLSSFFRKNICDLLINKKKEVDFLFSKKTIKNFSFDIQEKSMLLDISFQKIKDKISKKISVQKENFAKIASKIDALSPLKILKIGYALPSIENKIIKSVKEFKKDEFFLLSLHDGKINCKVKEIRKETQNGF